MQITNGSITFERTRKTADYEGKKASVTLSFTIADDEEASDVLPNVQKLAQFHALHMTGEQQAAEDVANKTGPAAPKTRAPRVAPPSAPPNPAPSVVAEAPSDPFGVAGEPAQKTPASADASATVSNSPSPMPVAEITDAMLQDAIKAKVAADAKHTPGVMELIQSFTGNPLAKIYSVADQAKRAEFLAKLTTL